MTHDSWGSTFSRSTIKLTTGLNTKNDFGTFECEKFDLIMELHGCLTVSSHDYLILFFFFFSLVLLDQMLSFDLPKILDFPSTGIQFQPARLMALPVSRRRDAMFTIFL